MKRFLALALSAVLALSMTACSSDEPSSSAEEPSSSQSEQLTIRVGGLKGPTAMGMVKLMADDAAGTTANDYEFTLAGAATEINPLLIQGELDIAAVPTNVASVLYNNTNGQVEIAALNTLGVLYVVENGDSVQSIADLAGKTVYSTGMGATPEYALNYILEKNGLTPGEDVTVEYLGEHSELAALLAAGEASIAVLPQPFVTSVLNQNPDVRIALDLTEEWDKVTEDGSKLTMGALVVRKEFAEQHPEELARFLEEYRASTEYVTDPANLDAAAALIGEQDIVTAEVAKQALPYCNIVCLTGEEMKTAAEGFLNILYTADPSSVGGALPAGDFYYLGEQRCAAESAWPRLRRCCSGWRCGRPQLPSSRSAPAPGCWSWCGSGTSGWRWGIRSGGSFPDTPLGWCWAVRSASPRPSSGRCGCCCGRCSG